MTQTVTLREITAENDAAVRALAVGPGQELFVDSVEHSLDEAASTPEANPWYRAIYAGDQPVGFVMLSLDIPPGHPEHPWRYFLCDGRMVPRGGGLPAAIASRVSPTLRRDGGK